MARLVIPNTATLMLPIPSAPTRTSFKPMLAPCSSQIRFTGVRDTRRDLAVVTRAGPSTSQYVFAFVFPLSLLAVTIFTSIKIADKLDRDYLEELAINQAIREADEVDEEDGDDGVDIGLEEEVQEPALPQTRTRNRPKREA